MLKRLSSRADLPFMRGYFRRPLLALILVSGMVLGACAKETPAPPQVQRPSPRPAAATPTVKESLEKTTSEAPVYAYKPKGRRDPFIPLVVAQEPSPKAKTGLKSLDVDRLKLAGIVWENKGYYALVESPEGLGYVVRSGDTIGEDAKVTRITSNSVFIKFKTKSTLPQPGLQEIELKLKREE